MASHRMEKIAAALKEGAGKPADDLGPKWLGMARGYVSNNMPDKARPIFQKIIDNYPDSEYAAKAKEALAALDAAGKKEPAK